MIHETCNDFVTVWSCSDQIKALEEVCVLYYCLICVFKHDTAAKLFFVLNK